MTRDFRKALKAADQSVAEAGMPREVDRRLRERLGLVESPRAATARWPRFALAGFAAACAALLLVLRLGQPEAPRQLGGFSVAEATADFGAAELADRAVQVTRGAATLVDPAEGISLAALGSGTVKREPGAVRVVAGSFRASVARRAPRSVPARILVSDGAIEVLGTQFTVEQGAGGGKVTLHEGSIRFVAADGRTVLLVPGESLAWPLPAPVVVPEAHAEAAPPQAAPEPAPVAAPVAAPRPPVRVVPAPVEPEARVEAARIEDLLQRIDELRSRNQYPAAAEELEAALKAGYTVATRERLSFELGALYGRPGSDPTRACRHWQEHERQFPHGRYDREIALALQRLGCPGP